MVLLVLHIIIHLHMHNIEEFLKILIFVKPFTVKNCLLNALDIFIYMIMVL